MLPEGTRMRGGWTGFRDCQPTIRLSRGKSHPPRHQAPWHEGGLHFHSRRASRRQDSARPGVAGSRPQR